MVRAPGTGEPLQISQLVVLDVNGANVARGKPCSVSSMHTDSSGNCANALDGNAVNKVHPYEFHSAPLLNDWFKVDLGANHVVKSIVYYNRAECCQSRMAGGLLQLLDVSGIVTTQRSMSGDMVSTYTFF
jgi:hypothetical protein